MTPMRELRDEASLQFTSVSRTHPGHRRTVNEDRVLDCPERGIWAVADGMGGHYAGDVAATKVVEALATLRPGVSGYARLRDASRKLAEVNTALFEDTKVRPSGSTVVTLLVHEGHYACLWAGDSRAYLFRDGVFTALTRDHSVVQQLVDGGALSEGDRQHHPSAHVITRAIGAASDIAIDQAFAAIQEDDVFLLCSDGLTGCVEKSAIIEALSEPSLERMADHLLADVLGRVALDNVSYVIIKAGV